MIRKFLGLPWWSWIFFGPPGLIIGIWTAMGVIGEEKDDNSGN
jgi:hypothetical protein